MSKRKKNLFFYKNFNLTKMSDKPLCCQHSEILVGKSGKVSFGFGCVIHPKAKSSSKATVRLSSENIT